MIKLILSILLIFNLIGNNEPSIYEVRKIYFEKVNTKEGVELLQSTLEKLPNSYKINGYRAGCQMVSSKYQSSPMKKLSVFKEGKQNLELIIKEQPEDMELRLIRLSIQENAPGIVNYNSNIDSDTDLLKNEKNTISDSNLIQHINNYFDGKN